MAKPKYKVWDVVNFIYVFNDFRQWVIKGITKTNFLYNIFFEEQYVYHICYSNEIIKYKEKHLDIYN